MNFQNISKTKEQLQAEISDLKMTLSDKDRKIEKLCSELSEADKLIDSLNSENTQNHEKVMNYNRAMSAEKDYLEKIAELQNQLSQKDSEITKLQDEVEAVKKAEKEKNCKIIENLEFDDYAAPGEKPKEKTVTKENTIRRRSLDTIIRQIKIINGIEE